MKFKIFEENEFEEITPVEQLKQEIDKTPDSKGPKASDVLDSQGKDPKEFDPKVIDVNYFETLLGKSAGQVAESLERLLLPFLKSYAAEHDRGIVKQKKNISYFVKGTADQTTRDAILDDELLNQNFLDAMNSYLMDHPDIEIEARKFIPSIMKIDKKGPRLMKIYTNILPGMVTVKVNSEKPGQANKAVIEAYPMVYAFQKAEINLKSPKVHKTQLGLSGSKELKAVIAGAKADKNIKDLEAQGDRIYEIMQENPDFDAHRGEFYDQIRKKGVSLAQKSLSTKTGKKSKLAVDNWNPADFIFIKNDTTSVPDKDTLTDYNSMFANNLLHGGSIKAVEPTKYDFKFIGISQKKTEKKARLGSAGQYFSEVVNVNTDVTDEEIKNLHEEKNAALKGLMDELNSTVSDMTYEYNDFDGSKKKTKVNVEFEYGMTQDEYWKNEKLTIPAMEIRYITLKNVTEIFKIDGGFIDIVKFSMASMENINPAFFKIAGGHIGPFNTEQFRVKFNEDKNISVKFPTNAKYQLESSVCKKNREFLKERTLSPGEYKEFSNDIYLDIPVVFEYNDGEADKTEEKLVSMLFNTSVDNKSRRLWFWPQGNSISDMAEHETKKESRQSGYSAERSKRSVLRYIEKNENIISKYFTDLKHYKKNIEKLSELAKEDEEEAMKLVDGMKFDGKIPFDKKGKRVQTNEEKIKKFFRRI